VRALLDKGRLELVTGFRLDHSRRRPKASSPAPVLDCRRWTRLSRRRDFAPTGRFCLRCDWTWMWQCKSQGPCTPHRPECPWLRNGQASRRRGAEASRCECLRHRDEELRPRAHLLDADRVRAGAFRGERDRR
jgi:hypothetical protein